MRKTRTKQLDAIARSMGSALTHETRKRLLTRSLTEVENAWRKHYHSPPGTDNSDLLHRVGMKALKLGATNQQISDAMDAAKDSRPPQGKRANVKHLPTGYVFAWEKTGMPHEALQSIDDEWNNEIPGNIEVTGPIGSRRIDGTMFRVYKALRAPHRYFATNEVDKSGR